MSEKAIQSAEKILSMSKMELAEKIRECLFLGLSPKITVIFIDLLKERLMESQDG